ncbi:TPT-domain-containing protein [Clavulina sp. PMI_390]|nr:TPT-domain-containing protein [Clavulina sp. PMI_390]
MLACSFDVSASDFVGLTSAFGSAIVFVSSNIFFKKAMPTQSEKGSGAGGLTTGSSTAPAHKLDKLNLLLYSSGFAFLLMIPLWMYNDLPTFLSSEPRTTPAPTVSVSYYYFLNATVHFAQNLIAFIILSSTSPVTYSIASLIKRIAVICIAVVWFAQHIHPIQGLGIGLTFVGLWMYNNAKGDVERGEREARKVEAQAALLLPNTARECVEWRGSGTPPLPSTMEETEPVGLTSGSAFSPAQEKPHGMTSLPPFALSSIVPRPAYVQQISAFVPPPPPSSSSIPPNSHSHPPPPPHRPPTSARSAPLNLGALDASIAAAAATKGLPHALSSPTGSYPSPPPSVGPTSPK